MLTCVDRFRELSDTEIAAFVNSGRNVFLVATPESPQSIQSLLKTFGVTFTSKAQVFDEFSPSGDSSLMITSSTSRSKAFDFPSGDIQFKGTAFTFSPSPLLFPLAWGPSTSYLKSKGKAISYGKDNVLIGALQSRNGARVVFLGSLDMITESLTEQKNEEFIQRVIEWNFKERGLLRNIGVQFHSAANASDINPKVLTVSDQLEYTIQVEEYKEGKWAPFSASDIQLEVIMLDPYIRVTLQDSGNGKFTASFPLPNTFGVYKLQVDYSAEGYSSIFSSEKLPVRPFRHDQYDRFLTAAFPYYTSAISMVIGFLVFSVAFLYSRK